MSCYIFFFVSSSFFFFNDTATTEIYTLSLHDALPISERRPDLDRCRQGHRPRPAGAAGQAGRLRAARPDRKSTRLNSSHMSISYAVFCLKKKKNNKKKPQKHIKTIHSK